MKMNATLSADGLYRYDLTRCWSDEKRPEYVCWIGLNPSTADAYEDDPTIRRMVGYTCNWGYAKLVVVNLFAYRATKPSDMVRAFGSGIDIVGIENDRAIKSACSGAKLIICGWGTNGGLLNRGQDMVENLWSWGVEPHRLKLTKNGHPAHPLYLRKDLNPTTYRKQELLD